MIGPLNIMGLHSPQSAILSAVIFNALIIMALIPLALRGVVSDHSPLPYYSAATCLFMVWGDWWRLFSA